MKKDLLDYMPELLELTKVARDKGLRMCVDYTDGYNDKEDLDLQGLYVSISDSNPNADFIYTEHISNYSMATIEETVNEVKEVLGVES